MLSFRRHNNLPKPKSAQFTRKVHKSLRRHRCCDLFILGQLVGGIQSSCQRHPLSGGIIDSRSSLKNFYHVACNGISIGLFPQMQPLLSARPPVQVCSCSVPTLVRFPAPLHSLITGNTSLSIPGHAEILHNYLGFRTKFEQKKNMRPFAGIYARFAGICARFAGTPGPRELRKPEK